jgi:hypothetical protein
VGAIGRANSHCQGVSRVIRFGYFRQAQKHFDHTLDLLFPGPAVSGHGLLDLKRGELDDRHTVLPGDQNDYSAGLAHHQGRLGVLAEKKLFYRDQVRLVPFYKFPKRFRYLFQPLRQRLVCACLDRAVLDFLESVVPRQPNYPKTGISDSGVNAQDYFVSVSACHWLGIF